MKINLYEMVYGLLLDSYCSPEIHYKRLMERCPNLKEAIPLKNIASFLGVTPETVSHIRRKLRKQPYFLTFKEKGLEIFQGLFYLLSRTLHLKSKFQ